MDQNALNVLIVDDSKTIVKYLQELLNQREHNLFYCFTKKDALKIIESNDIDLLICDIFLPEKPDGLQIKNSQKQVNNMSKTWVCK